MSDFPTYTKPFNKNAYRSAAAYKSHLQNQGMKASPIPRQAPRTITRPAPGPTLRTVRYKAPRAPDSPSWMTDEEVKAWFREGEEEYEALKKAGYYDDYVPAAGPSRGALADTANSLSKRKTGMENSMWAPKNRPITLNPAARLHRPALANSTNALPKRKTGLENSMHAPKNAKLSIFTSRGYSADPFEQDVRRN
ncbi:hypothetical protein QBC32DRAFT_393457 [Pseudoneurospora amorphoporcata]|uniref:Uncharacterized protein n=1 Tax=Pseudoneurospora amorphoporcata TaxID=241081 RepID=A0AAN6NTW0_9PEZI|nr:hypothetical protein QBC32DRAFT_393457 [Pseudoneurospora amorphoporcata]